MIGEPAVRGTVIVRLNITQIAHMAPIRTLAGNPLMLTPRFARSETALLSAATPRRQRTRSSMLQSSPLKKAPDTSKDSSGAGTPAPVSFAFAERPAEQVGPVSPCECRLDRMQTHSVDSTLLTLTGDGGSTGDIGHPKLPTRRPHCIALASAGTGRQRVRIERTPGRAKI